MSFSGEVKCFRLSVCPTNVNDKCVMPGPGAYLWGWGGGGWGGFFLFMYWHFLFIGRLSLDLGPRSICQENSYLALWFSFFAHLRCQKTFSIFSAFAWRVRLLSEIPGSAPVIVLLQTPQLSDPHLAGPTCKLASNPLNHKGYHIHKAHQTDKNRNMSI